MLKSTQLQWATDSACQGLSFMFQLTILVIKMFKNWIELNWIYFKNELNAP